MNPSRVLDHDWFPRPLPANVVFGRQSWCYSAFAFVHCRSQLPLAVQVGNSSGIYNGTFFDLGPRGQVTIGDYCTLVGAIIATNGKVKIEDYAFVAHEVVLADDFAATPQSFDEREPQGITLGENCWIGARAILLGGAQIGQGAIVGAGAVVSGVVPAYAIAAGNPARIVGRVRTTHV